MCVLSSKLPIAPMGFSHIWHLLVLAGRWCRCGGWHSDHLIVHHHRQHSFWIGACSCSKLPIAPMGIPAHLPNRLSSFNSDRYLVLSGICTCQPRLQTSHRPDGKCLVDMSISILIFDDGCCLDLPVWSTCHLRLKLQKFPLPRWDFHMLCAYARRAAVSLFGVAR